MSLLSNLSKRNFIMKNIHEDAVKVFKTRWVLSYLKGPISKDDIKRLMSEKIKMALNKPEEISSNTRINSNSSNTSSRPILPNDLEEYFNYLSQQDSYQMQPYLLASCNLNFFNASKNIDIKKNYH